MSTPDGAPVRAGQPVVGLQALRTFRLSEDGHLVPLGTFNGDWLGGLCIARCLHHRDHEPPVEECTCGVYAFRNLDALRHEYAEARDVLAVIALEGNAIEGDLAWRAQAAQVIALWLSPTGVPAELAELVRVNHPAIRFFDGVDEMITAHPDLAVPSTEIEDDDPPEPVGRTALDRLMSARPAIAMAAPWLLLAAVYRSPSGGTSSPIRAGLLGMVALSLVAAAWIGASAEVLRRVNDRPPSQWAWAVARGPRQALRWLRYWQIVNIAAVTLTAIDRHQEDHWTTSQHAAQITYAAFTIGFALWGLRQSTDWRPEAPASLEYPDAEYPAVVGPLDPEGAQA